MWKQHAVPLCVTMEVLPCRSEALARRSPQFPIWHDEEEELFRLEATSRRVVLRVLQEIFDAKKYFERKMFKEGAIPDKSCASFCFF